MKNRIIDSESFDFHANCIKDGLTKIMIVGLQGTGKTTQLGKLANHLKKFLLLNYQKILIKNFLCLLF